MPTVMERRLIKNGATALLCLAAGIIMGVTERNIGLFAIALIMAASIVAGSIGMPKGYKNGKYYVVTGTCATRELGVTKTSADVTIVCYDDETDEEFTITLVRRKLFEFRVGVTYELLFRNTGASLSSYNFIDKIRLDESGDIAQRSVKISMKRREAVAEHETHE